MVRVVLFNAELCCPSCFEIWRRGEERKPAVGKQQCPEAGRRGSVPANSLQKMRDTDLKMGLGREKCMSRNPSLFISRRSIGRTPYFQAIIRFLHWDKWPLVLFPCKLDYNPLKWNTSPYGIFMDWSGQLLYSPVQDPLPVILITVHWVSDGGLTPRLHPGVGLGLKLRQRLLPQKAKPE